MELDLSRPIGGPCSNPPTSKVPLFLRILTLPCLLYASLSHLLPLTRVFDWLHPSWPISNKNLIRWLELEPKPHFRLERNEHRVVTLLTRHPAMGAGSCRIFPLLLPE